MHEAPTTAGNWGGSDVGSLTPACKRVRLSIPQAFCPFTSFQLFPYHLHVFNPLKKHGLVKVILEIEGKYMGTH